MCFPTSFRYNSHSIKICHFKMCKICGYSIFTELWNCLYKIPEHFHRCKKFSVFVRSDCLFLAPAPGNYSSSYAYEFAYFGHFMLMESYNMWPFCLFCHLPQSDEFKLHPCCSMDWYCFFCGWILSLYWYTVFFACPLGCAFMCSFCFLHIMNTTMNTLCRCFHFSYVF